MAPCHWAPLWANGNLLIDRVVTLFQSTCEPMTWDRVGCGAAKGDIGSEHALERKHLIVVDAITIIMLSDALLLSMRTLNVDLT
jgi:hypothetical protein